MSPLLQPTAEELESTGLLSSLQRRLFRSMLLEIFWDMGVAVLYMKDSAKQTAQR